MLRYKQEKLKAYRIPRSPPHINRAYRLKQTDRTERIYYAPGREVRSEKIRRNKQIELKVVDTRLKYFRTSVAI